MRMETTRHRRIGLGVGTAAATLATLMAFSSSPIEAQEVTFAKDVVKR